MEFLEDKQSLGREDCNVPIFEFPYYAFRVTSGGLIHTIHMSDTRSSVNLKHLEEFYGAKIGVFTKIHHQDHFYMACSWFCGILSRF